MKFSELLALAEDEATEQTAALAFSELVAQAQMAVPSLSDFAAQMQARVDAEINRARADMLAAIAEHERALINLTLNA